MKRIYELKLNTDIKFLRNGEVREASIYFTRDSANGYCL